MNLIDNLVDLQYKMFLLNLVKVIGYLVGLVYLQYKMFLLNN